MKRCTASDVAREARVSTMTVSNVLNGHFEMMSADTRQRVEDAITKLNYRPYAAGRSLRLNERLTIGVLIVDESPTFLADPFTTNLLAGLSNFLSSRGYGLLVQGTTPRDMRNAIFLRRLGTDGLCVLLSGTEDECSARISQLMTFGQPLVVLESRIASRKPGDICSIRQDNFGGARDLTRHLVELGARRFVHLVPKLPWPAITERRRGVETALRSVRKASLTVVESGEHFEEARNALDSYLADNSPPDAVIGGNDQMGIAAMRLLIDRGYRVPDDVMVTGFNAFEFRLHTDPILTSVISSAYEIGSKAGSELLRRLTDGRFAEPEILLPTTFVLGGSTGHPAKMREQKKRRTNKH
jgi:LacI family transcriptional regulator, galactose operon repressor